MFQGKGILRVVAIGVGLLSGCALDGAPRGTAVTFDSDHRAPAISLNFPPEPQRQQVVNNVPVASEANEPVSLNRSRPISRVSHQVSAALLEEDEGGVDEPFQQPDEAGPLTRFARSLGHDTRSLVNWETGTILLLGGGASLAVRETVDDDVSDWTAQSLHRWGEANDVFGALGNPGHHFAASALLWGAGVMTEDEHLRNLSGAMMNTLVITNASTLLLKFAADTDSPNGESQGWPSGHTSSSVALAAVLDEYYGPWVGVPAYALAGMVGWSRIDDREHDLSDVIFGAALGYAIGKVVAANHHRSTSNVTLLPYLDPVEGTSGIGFEKRF